MQELEKILEEINLLDIIYDVDNGGCLLRQEDVEEIIRKHMNGGWIPVNKDHIPEGEILACDIYENELIGYLSYDTDSESFICEDDGCIMEQVIAWMKKPDPYRPERSDNHDGE